MAPQVPHVGRRGAGGDALITVTTMVADNDRYIQNQRPAGLDGAEV